MRTEFKATLARSRGLVLLALLVFVALSSLWIALAADVWSTVRQREREENLLYVGEQYRHAIESYWRMGAVRTLPPSLDVLLTDDRFPNPVHHLRRLYADPITGGEIGLVKENNGISGVYSISTEVPRKVAGFPPRYQHFADANSYDQWRFVFVPPRRGRRVSPPPSAGLDGGSRFTQTVMATTQ